MKTVSFFWRKSDLPKGAKPVWDGSARALEVKKMLGAFEAGRVDRIFVHGMCCVGWRANADKVEFLGGEALYPPDVLAQAKARILPRNRARNY